MRPVAIRCASLFILALVTPCSLAEVSLETRDLRLELTADAKIKSLFARPIGAELAFSASPEPFALIYRGGEMTVASQEDYAEHQLPEYRGGERLPATSAALEGDLLTLAFAPTDVFATYKVTTTPDYLAFKLVRLAGGPVDRIDLRLPVKRLANLGAWINVAWDDRFGLCFCGGNVKTCAGMAQHPDFADMRVVATREVALEGSVAVLFGCAHPRERFLDAMATVEREFQMPAGAAARRSPAQRHSYLWCAPTPGDIDQYIAVAKRAGFRTLLYSYSAFSKGAGTFEFNSQYPRGIADLKAVADRIRAAGLNVGLHIHYTKADRADQYVTPVPDDRLRVERPFTLAREIDAHTSTIEIKENPDGSATAEGRRILKIGKELVSYTGFTTTPPYSFTGCERGHLRTRAAAHPDGAPAGLLDVDDWIKFIRFDQATDIQDETARRIAEIYNATGPYEMLYFDGAEDVHHPFWYHVAKAQYSVYHLLDPPPPVCEAAMNSHFGWHMMSRGNAFDDVGTHLKPFIREISCREAGYLAADFTTMDFGWVYRLLPDHGPDVFEYVLSRGAAFDCPFSLRLVSLAEVAAHPRANDCFDAIKTWEDARIAGIITQAQKAELRTLDPAEYQHIKTWPAVFDPRWIATYKEKPFADREHHLFIHERGDYELVEVKEVPNAAGGRVRAWLFQRSAEPANTYAVVWAAREGIDLQLPLAPERLKVMRPFGRMIPFEHTDARCSIPVADRLWLRLENLKPDVAARLLKDQN